MGFRCQHHQAAIDERHAVLKNRPKWQDVVPKTKAGRTAYEIAAKHEKKFAGAFRAAVSSLLSTQLPPGFKAAWDSRSVPLMVSALPLFSKEKQAGVYEQFRSSLASAYLAVIRESGKAEAESIKAKFGVKKAEGKEFAEVAVAVNPRSVKWIQRQSLKLIKEGMTKEQGKTVRAIIKDNFSKGVRAEEVYSNIKQNIGLTSRDYQAVLNRRDLHERAGLPKAEVERLTSEYREQKFEERAERIARTETIAAQAEGRQETWTTMKEEGQLPEVRRKWIAAPPGGKTCVLCYDELDGQEVEIDEPYTTESGDTYDGPPAHPQCRCTEVLVRVGSDGE